MANQRKSTLSNPRDPSLLVGESQTKKSNDERRMDSALNAEIKAIWPTSVEKVGVMANQRSQSKKEKKRLQRRSSTRRNLGSIFAASSTIVSKKGAKTLTPSFRK